MDREITGLLRDAKHLLHKVIRQGLCSETKALAAVLLLVIVVAERLAPVLYARAVCMEATDEQRTD